MEAISKKVNKRRFTGKIAALMVKVGAATPVEDLKRQEEEARILKEQEAAELVAAMKQKETDEKDAELEKVKLIKSAMSPGKPRTAKAPKKVSAVKKVTIKKVKK